MSRPGLDAYKIVLHRQDDGSWVAEVPAVSGCYAVMATREEALAELSHVFDLIAAEYPERNTWEPPWTRLARREGFAVKKTWLASRFVILVSLAVFAATAAAQGWKLYEAKAYGFSMLIPEGTTVREREWSGGWGGIYAQHEGVRLYGLAKLGTKASDDEIEKFAVDVVGIAREEWTIVDEGIMEKGWIRHHTVRATKGSKLVFGGYGVGPKGSYLLYLETTPADFREYKADYEKWYASIELE